MLCVAIIILQSTLTYTSVTLPYVTYFWQTTEDIDKVDDYWNHGPIYIPGLQDVFTLTTKAPDIFPPWLTRGTTQSTQAPKYVTPQRVTPFSTTTTPVESTKTENLTTDKSKTIEDTKDKTTAKTEPIATTNTITTQHITPTIQQSESGEDGATDPFSVFLKKLFRSLSVKSLPELPALVEPFVTYLEELANNELNYLGDVIIPFVKMVARNIRNMISTTPDVLHAKVYQVYNALATRNTLDPDVLGLLYVLDDTFVEAEEEFMQSSLRDVKLFPNSNKTGKEIAHDLVDNIILAAIKRISGTSKGETLSLMVTDIIEKRKSNARRHLETLSEHVTANDKASSDKDDTINRPIHRLNISSSISSYHGTQRKKKSVNNWYNKKTQTDASIMYAQALYQTVRNNLKDIRNLMDKVIISSSETNEYELSVDSESEDNVRSTPLTPKQTDNIHFRINKESKSSEYTDSEELPKLGSKNSKKQGRTRVLSEDWEHFIEEYSKAHSGHDDVGLEDCID
ncbi:uncharacterized protein LOC133532819 [Cydia pomonella]|uniref:uncharacterized protein LOC133532819 n=1 Tax=Cydia pomonella TaxID=82600 RepID=UPI002ADD7C0D|nr:uncharacterized protein LOC133532819 [Cydia pomonella]